MIEGQICSPGLHCKTQIKYKGASVVGGAVVVVVAVDVVGIGVVVVGVVVISVIPLLSPCQVGCGSGGGETSCL